MAALRSMLRRLRAEESGFTVVEISVAVLILTSGVIGVFSTIDGSRDLNSQSELKEAASHRAEREIERLRALEFPKLAHSSTPAASSDPKDPRSRISGSPARFAWDKGNAANSEKLAVAAEGQVAAGPETFEDGRFTYRVWRFVTESTDPACASSGIRCLDFDGYYKRATVVVEITGLENNVSPIWVSSLVSDPEDAPTDSLTAPFTECLDSLGNAIQCRNSTSDTVNSWFLSDTPATSDTRQPILGSHSLHPTIAPLSLLLPRTPDLLSTTAPPSSEPPPPVYKYSSDHAGGYTGGRLLRRDVECGSAPSTTDNTKGAFWTTPMLVGAKTLNGSGGLSLYTHTLDGVQAEGTLCMAFYDVPTDILGLALSPPVEIGRTSFRAGSWPTEAESVAFAFDFKSSGTVTVPTGHRIGVRVWMASSSGADVALVYDHPTYPSYLQLNEPGS